MNPKERAAIDRLWARKITQETQDLPQSQRHRNLEPASAEFLYALVTGLGAKKVLEIGGSSGISTIALASAARQTQGKLISLEIEPTRQAESKNTMAALDLQTCVEFHLGDAAEILPKLSELEFVLIDCEKEDYIRFFDMLRVRPSGVVVADNILSHHLTDYVAHVRATPGAESMTLPIGKGLEITRIAN